jgi:hypothetical protein
MTLTEWAYQKVVAIVAIVVVYGERLAFGIGAIRSNGMIRPPPSRRPARSGDADVVLPSVAMIRAAGALGQGVVSYRAGGYPADDLAVIPVKGASCLRPARFGDFVKPRSVDAVLAIGTPFGPPGNETEGIVPATGRAVTQPAGTGSTADILRDAIQTSAPICPGNSGGALVNTVCEVTGIPGLAAAGPATRAHAQGAPASRARPAWPGRSTGRLIHTGPGYQLVPAHARRAGYRCYWPTGTAVTRVK